MIFEVRVVVSVKTLVFYHVPPFSPVGNSLLLKSQITAFNRVM